MKNMKSDKPNKMNILDTLNRIKCYQLSNITPYYMAGSVSRRDEANPVF